MVFCLFCLFFVCLFVCVVFFFADTGIFLLHVYLMIFIVWSHLTARRLCIKITYIPLCYWLGLPHLIIMQIYPCHCSQCWCIFIARDVRDVITAGVFSRYWPQQLFCMQGGQGPGRQTFSTLVIYVSSLWNILHCCQSIVLGNNRLSPRHKGDSACCEWWYNTATPSRKLQSTVPAQP